MSKIQEIAAAVEAGKAKIVGGLVEEAIKECVAACTDLGLSLKDIEKAVQRYIRKVERQRSGAMADVVEFRSPAPGSADKEARNA